MDYFDLGVYTRAITTESDEAQRWFDCGLNWMYAYNHQEAIACFEKAAAADPQCAMAQWGIAYAAGPNYNLPWDKYDPDGRAAALGQSFDAGARAVELASNATSVERALIETLPTRYPQRELVEDMMAWNYAYTIAMRKVHEAYPNDRDVGMIFVEAMMNETPWQMWNLKTGAVADDARTDECRAVLEGFFRDDPGSWDHPGLLHLYVHLMEMSPFPELALRMGDRLRDIVPDAGHLIHMPTHIDVQCGNYHDVVLWNQKAIVADRQYLEYAGALNIYSMYRIHNYHFVIYGAMFLGQYTPAIEAAQELIDTTPEELMRIPSPPMADFTEGYLSMKQHVMIRFGRWQDILDQTLPEDKELYCSTIAMMLYAKSVASSATGDIDGAEKYKEAFLTAKDAVSEGRRVHNNVVTDILLIAEQMLLGELEYRRGNYAVAFDHLRQSVALDDGLLYDEPWGWMQPARHALGALLIEQGHYKEAEQVYREDLGLDPALNRACQHPNNIWSLHGLHECLTHRGEKVESIIIKQQLDLAAARAEFPVKASCFCRQEAMVA